MLKSTFILETVTFSDNTGYGYPEISGYGNEIKIELKYHHDQDKQNSITVEIGDYCLVPSQIDEIQKEISVYRKAIEAEGAKPYEEKEIVVSTKFGEVSLSALKNDVESAKEKYDPTQFSFTSATVEALINKIEELSK